MSLCHDDSDKLAFEHWITRQRPEYSHIKVTPLSLALGAEASGIDLRQEVAPEQLSEVRQAIADNLVLVFREQDITAEHHKRFARHFGTLQRQELGADDFWNAGELDPEVLPLRTGKGSRFNAGDGWHNDVSCDRNPIWGSFLHITRVPKFGSGDAGYANLYLAYESLSDPIKALLDGLTAIHDGKAGWSKGYGSKPEAGQEFPANEHPVVPRHPLTGRKFLFVSAAFTTHIPQLTRAKSDELLQLLFRHIEKQEFFQTRIHWSPNSLVFWDNWATQHHAVWHYYPFERWGKRVSVLLDQGPQT